MFEPSALVVIPTTGEATLGLAISSVISQSHKNLQCLVVVDGPEFLEKTLPITNKFQTVKVMTLPFNTGGNQYYGHRIYAASAFLTNSDYWLALDQDNFFKSDHVESQVYNCEINQLDWSYSLRSIFDKSGNYVLDDNCESLGKWPVHFSNENFLVDTSCYCIKREVITKIGGVWHGRWGQDRVFYSTISKYFPKYDTTGLHTLCYRLDGNPMSVNEEFFASGNARMHTRYGEKFPWNR